MIEIMLILLKIVCCLYILLNIILLIGINLQKNNFQSEKNNFSIIVAAQNEEKNIAELLNILISQNYPKDKYEIIVVNDRSFDGSVEVVEKFENVKLINVTELESNYFGKKNALRIGIENAKNEILVFTDADCLPNINWLSEINKLYESNTGAIVGYSPYINNSKLNCLLNEFIQYEELKANLIGFSVIGLGGGIIASGRNFSYRKKVYDEVNGFRDINHSLSGDDDLFLQTIVNKTNWKIKYMNSEESFVFTNSKNSFKEFFVQRLRHLSASKFYSFVGKLIFSAIHINSIIILIAFLFSFSLAIKFFLLKLIIDFTFISFGKLKLNSNLNLLKVFYLEVFLIAYYFLFGVISLIKKPKWN